MQYAKISGTGSYLPANRVSNDDLAKKVDTSDEWITTRTGIKFRHIADDSEKTSDLAAKSARRALADANLQADDIDHSHSRYAVPFYGNHRAAKIGHCQRLPCL